MLSSLSVRGSFGRLAVTASPATSSASVSASLPNLSFRSFSATSAALARKAPVKPVKGNVPVRKSRQPQRSDAYRRIAILKQNLFSPAPPPLRMARLRYLRHWTIHRAWMLFRRQQKEAIDAERSRMHAGMYNACEELRKTKGPAGRGEGYLYRVAMEKKGVWRMGAVPIEYGRMQTDTPPKEAWDHNWKR